MTNVSAVYCHCYPAFACEAAVAEAIGPNGEQVPLCERCQQMAFDAGRPVRKLRPLDDRSRL